MIAVFAEALEITIVSAPKKSSSARKSSTRNEVKNVDGVRLDVAVALVGGRQLGAVYGGVDEPLVVDAVGTTSRWLAQGKYP